MGAATDLQRLASPVRNPVRFMVGPAVVGGSFAGSVQVNGIGLAGNPVASLGFMREVAIDWDVLQVIKRDPSSGAIVEVGRSVETPIVSVVIDGANWDEDALEAAFTYSRRALTSMFPVEVRIGGTLIPSIVKPWQPILMASLDPALKSGYFARPLPILSLRSSVAFALERKGGLGLKFIPTPDSLWATREPWQIARIANLTP